MKRYASNAIVVFCYLIQDGKVLLIKRMFPPYQGECTVVGGKKERGEDVLAACKREVLEETGLRIGDLELRGLLTNTDLDTDYDVLTVYFKSEDFDGEVYASEEGSLEWCEIESSLTKPGVNAFYQLITPYVLHHNGVFFGTVTTEKGRIVKSEIY